jgi:GH24 family phage-related lysozyme (muramidase)
MSILGLTAKISKTGDYSSFVEYYAEKYRIKLNQHQFDVLVSFLYNYGENWLTVETRVMPAFIIKGNGVYNPEEVMEVFLKHENRDRRRREAGVFINGYPLEE